MSKEAGYEKNVKRANSGYTSLVPAVEQAARILICLAKSPTYKMRLTDICNVVGIHKSKGYSILNTLRRFGFVERDLQAKTYSLGPGLIFLSRKVLDNIDFRETVSPFLKTLAKETNSTAVFGLISGENLFVVAKHDGDSHIGVTIQLGHRFHLTAGAHGKAIVAFLPEGDRERILMGEKLYFHGDVTRLNMERLRDELARCRQEGFARDVGELHAGINAVAAPVFGSLGKLIGSLVVIGTFPGYLVEHYGYRVAESARQISYTLGADVEGIYHRVSMKGA